MNSQKKNELNWNQPLKLKNESEIENAWDFM